MTGALREEVSVPRIQHILARDAIAAGQHVENELAQRIDIGGRRYIDRATFVEFGGYKKPRTDHFAINRIAFGSLVER